MRINQVLFIAAVVVFSLAALGTPVLGPVATIPLGLALTAAGLAV